MAESSGDTADEMAPPKKAKTTLLSLPRELRDIIYEDVFSSTRVHIFSRQWPYPAKVPGLRLACKQLFAETHEAFYKCSIFVVESQGVLMLDAAKWLAKLSNEDRDAIQQIRIVRDTGYVNPGRTVRLVHRTGADCAYFQKMCMSCGIKQFREGVLSEWWALSAGC